MKELITASALAVLIAVPAFTQSAAAASKARRDSDNSWQCYPYCPGGYYEGRPVREWFKGDSW